jgi:SAM-dependent methyltransferase
MKLNLGSGYKRYPGFVNIDADRHCQPDYLVNLESDPLPFETNSVEEIKAYHILEHIGPGFMPLMREIYRVCTHGALIDIHVPHHFHETFLSDPTHKRPITVEGMRLLSKKVNRLEIERNGTSSTLGIIYDIDFELVDFEFVVDAFYDPILPTLAQQERYRLMRESNNVILETRIKLMTIKE